MQGCLPFLGSSGPRWGSESLVWPRPTLKVDLQLILTLGSEWPPPSCSQEARNALRCGGKGVCVCVPYTYWPLRNG